MFLCGKLTFCFLLFVFCYLFFALCFLFKKLCVLSVYVVKHPVNFSNRF
jgi:hypothetical protein